MQSILIERKMKSEVSNFRNFPMYLKLQRSRPKPKPTNFVLKMSLRTRTVLDRSSAAH